MLFRTKKSHIGITDVAGGMERSMREKLSQCMAKQGKKNHCNS